MKYKIKEDDSESAFTLYSSSQRKLFSFGLFDFAIQRQGNRLECVYCNDIEKCSFDYESFSNSLFIESDDEKEYNTVFVKRVIIIQLK